MDDYERAVSFNLGEAFPANDRVSAFLMALSLAWKDLIYVNRRLVGGDADGPAKHAVSDGEMRYLVGLASAHLYEMRTCIGEAEKKWPEVGNFLKGLPADAQDDLRRVLDLNTEEHDWIEPTLKYLRNQTFHYGGKTNWKDVRWAMRQVATESGAISMANDTYAGTRLDFAELVWVQHLTRKFPSGEADTDEETQQVFHELLTRILIEALATAMTASIRFVMAALAEYLNGLPDGVVELESP